MGLVQSNKKSSTLNRGHDIKPKEMVSFNEINQSSKPTPSYKEQKVEEIEEQLGNDFKQVTTSTSVRVDNHVKNKLEALVNLGIVTSQKDAIDHIIEPFINQNLSDDDRQLYQMHVDALEKRDARLAAKKTR